MIRIKRFAAVLAVACIGALAAFGLAGCGDGDVAATWNHGKILEENVTARAQSDMSSFMNADYVTYDVEGWTAYIVNREYDPTGDYSEAGEAGTLEEYRAYLINQIFRSEVEAWAIEDADIEISEEEIDAQVAEDAAMYEMYFGGGHAGTFESILEVYMGMDMETYRENVANSLAKQKFQMQVCEVETPDEIDTEVYEAYLDELVASFNLKIKDMPSDLPYDPANVPAGDPATEPEVAPQDDTEADDSDSE